MTTENFFIECDTIDDAERRAQREASDSSLEVLPVKMFKQGSRNMASGALAVRALTRMLYSIPVGKGTPASDLHSGNRPVDAKHVRNIKEYLKGSIRGGSSYIIPPVTVNADPREVRVFFPKGRSLTTGFVVLPPRQSIRITDGQHRFQAIVDTISDLRREGVQAVDEFENDGVPLVITWEADEDQVHQDFADASKTKALPKSMIAVYDARHPANRAVMELIRNVPLFVGRIDATSTTLSKNSGYLFLANQVRQFVKAKLSGKPSMSEDAFNKVADEQLADPEAYRRWVDETQTYLTVLTDLIPQWSEIADFPAPRSARGPEANARMRALKEKGWVSISAGGLNSLGLLGYKLFSQSELAGSQNLEADLRMSLAPIRDIDWSRGAEIWQGNLVQEGKIKTQTGSISRAAEKLWASLDQSSPLRLTA